MPTTLETNSLQDPNTQVSGPQQSQQDATQGATPYDIINTHLTALKNEYGAMVKNIHDQTLTPKNYQQILNAHQHYQDEYNQKKASILGVKNQLDVINKLMNTGQLDQNSGTQAMWKAVLPEDVANAMFPHTRKEDSFNQVQMKQLTGYVKPDGTQAMGLAQKYADEEKIPTTWSNYFKNMGNTLTTLMPTGVVKRDESQLIPQYQAYLDDAEAQLGDTMTNLQRRQADKVWDNEMQKHRGYEWKPDTSATIQGLRAQGKLAQAGGRRLAPLQEHFLMYNTDSQVTEEKPQIAVNGQNSTGTPVSGPPPATQKIITATHSKTGQKIMSADGGKTWQLMK